MGGLRVAGVDRTEKQAEDRFRLRVLLLPGFSATMPAQYLRDHLPHYQEFSFERSMAKKIFSPAERLAVYTVHGEKCYLCTKPIDLKTMQVDHVIPESLEGTAKLDDVLHNFGLPPAFDLQSYDNWLPACAPCNNFKRDQVFEPVPIVLMQLKKAADKAPKARAIAEKVVTDKLVQNALNTLERAINNDAFRRREIMAQMEELLRFQTANRAPEMVGKPVLLGPGLELLADQGGIRIVRGPYGVGGGPSGDYVAPEMRCHCGSAYFNGARCIACGQMDDD